jgi:hypothetical protein
MLVHCSLECRHRRVHVADSQLGKRKWKRADVLRAGTLRQLLQYRARPGLVSGRPIDEGVLSPVVP